MSFQPALEDDRRSYRIDGLFLLPAPDQARSPLFRLEAGEPLVMKFDSQTGSLAEALREIPDMARHRTLAPVHIEREPNDDAVDPACCKRARDRLEIRFQRTAFQSA